LWVHDVSVVFMPSRWSGYVVFVVYWLSGE